VLGAQAGEKSAQCQRQQVVGHRGRVEPRRRTSPWNSATAQLEWVASSRELAAALAQNYTGLPYDQGWS
jgi:hypothetical protein